MRVTTGRTTADGVHLRQMLGGAFERIDDALIMIIGVRLKVRIPHNLLAEFHLAIHDRRRLAIAAA